MYVQTHYISVSIYSNHTSRKLSISAGAHMNQSIKRRYLNNYHVLENLSIDIESAHIDYAECYIERHGCEACSGPCTSRFSGEVHDPDVGELNPVKSFSSILLSISNECNLRILKSFSGQGNYLYHCWHRRKLHWLLMATCALSLIIKRQSYPEPILLVSASLHKQPLNTFAGLFLLLKQEQQAEVEEKVNFMNFKHIFSLFYIFFWAVSEL